MTAKNGCPRENEYHFHLKEQEYQRDDIEARIKGQPRAAGGFFAALEGSKLFRIRFFGRYNAVDKKYQRDQHDTYN